MVKRKNQGKALRRAGFMIKTMKLIDAEGARKIKAKSELMKKRRMEKAAERAAKLMRMPFF